MSYSSSYCFLCLNQDLFSLLTIDFRPFVLSILPLFFRHVFFSRPFCSDYGRFRSAPATCHKLVPLRSFLGSFASFGSFSLLASFATHSGLALRSETGSGSRSQIWRCATRSGRAPRHPVDGRRSNTSGSNTSGRLHQRDVWDVSLYLAMSCSSPVCCSLKESSMR